MLYQVLFYASLAAILAACGAAAFVITRRPLQPFARNLLIALIVFEVVVAGLHVYTIFNRAGGFWDWFFDLQYEFNLGAMFSSLQLMLVAFVALLNTRLVPGLGVGQRLYWLLLALVFAFLSVDEFYALHETWGARVDNNAWRVPYAVGGVTLVVVSLLAFFYGFRSKLRLFVMLFMGLAVMGIAGIAIEEFIMEGFVYQDSTTEWLYVIEEGFEMVGATIVLAGFVAYLQDHADGQRWRVARRALVTLAGVWVGWMLFVLFGQSAVEARLLATTINVTYEDGLVLLAYDMSPAQAEPGSEVEITLYWRANQPLTENYSVSFHALSHPDIDSVAQSDDLHLAAVPSSAWLPGMVTKRTYYLRLPKDLPAPASYWLLTRVWFGPWPLGRPWEDTTGLPIADSGDRRRLADDGLILAHIAVVPGLPPSAPPSQTNFHFPTDGITLYGYALPQDDITLHRFSVGFWWRTDEQPPQRDWTQFFHLVPSGGGETVAFDGQPFSGTFPTVDWPADMEANDLRTIHLPDGLEPGTYDVFAGLYSTETGERAAVVGANGQPVANNAILLGRIEFAPAAASAADEPPPGIRISDYCFAIADLDLLRPDGQDVMVAMHKQTGQTVTIGRTGTISVEAATFSADGRQIFSVDDLDTHGQFVVGDPRIGVLAPVGTGLTPPGQPARSSGQPPDSLIDIDGISIDPTDGRLWAVTQDERNLFEINPETGMVVRDRFGQGNDFLHILIDDLTDAAYIKIEDLAIDPRDGTFYVIVTSQDYVSILARLDFDTLDRDRGTIRAVEVGPFVDAASGTRIADVEGLSFDVDGTLYAVSTDNSNLPAYHDAMWRVTLPDVRASFIGRFGDHVDYVDFEGLACAGRD